MFEKQPCDQTCVLKDVSIDPSGDFYEYWDENTRMRRRVYRRAVYKEPVVKEAPVHQTINHYHNCDDESYDTVTTVANAVALDAVLHEMYDDGPVNYSYSGGSGGGGGASRSWGGGQTREETYERKTSGYDDGDSRGSYYDSDDRNTVYDDSPSCDDSPSFDVACDD